MEFLAPLIIPDNNMNWNNQDQEILEWLFPVLRVENSLAPRTPECTRPARPARPVRPARPARPARPLLRQNALSPQAWEILLK